MLITVSDKNTNESRRGSAVLGSNHYADSSSAHSADELFKEAKSLEAELTGRAITDLSDDFTVNSDYSDLESRIENVERQVRKHARSFNRKPGEQGYSQDVREEAAYRTLVRQGYSPSEARESVEAMVEFDMLPDPPRR
jgi:hypothetical protein